MEPARGRRTKIVATWGPAVRERQTIRRLVRAGVDVFRLNFSHATHEELRDAIPRIRSVAEEEGRAVGLLQDIQGPRIRTGFLVDGGPVVLAAGSSVTIKPEDTTGTNAVISVGYPRLAEDVSVGDRVLLADGAIVLRVTEVVPPDVHVRVVQGGVLGQHKGVNLPDSGVSVATLTEKDKEDLRFGAEQDVDYVALSFVRRRDDILECRRYLHALGSTAPIIAKIEHPLAIRNLEGILVACDGVMVARGDLGVEMSPEEVPVLQKQLIRRANEMGLPVITATQMLESMVEHATPTRAEASDVANAVLDGTDALMLSAETAVGGHALAAVETMARIAVEAERAVVPRFSFPGSDQRHALALTARNLAERLEARAIVVVTRSGNSARFVSHHRPITPVFAFTDDPSTQRRLTLWYGVTPLLGELSPDPATMFHRSLADLRRRGVLDAGDTAVIVGAMPWMPGAQANFVTAQSVPAETGC